MTQTVHETETRLNVSEELPDEVVDMLFAKMAALAELEETQLSDVETLKQQREAIIAELLEKNPHEAISEIVHTLLQLYDGRKETTQLKDGSVVEFATRDKTNQRLDDHFLIYRDNDGNVVELAAEFMDFDNMGYEVRVRDDRVEALLAMKPGYRVNLTPGTERYSEVIREFYMRSLTTAGIVRKRIEMDFDGAVSADSKAKQMLKDEIAAAS